MISNLPMEMLNKIFEYDGTYREKYNEVMDELQTHRTFMLSHGWDSYKGKWFMVQSSSFFFEENRVWEFSMFPSDLSWVDHASEWFDFFVL